MRHKWDIKKVTKKNFATCLKCGCIKEVLYPLGYVYYFEDNVYEFEIKTPECKVLT